MYATIQSAEESRLLGTGVGADAAYSQSVAIGFQEVLTLMIVTLVAAVIVSALRGKDPKKSKIPPAPGGTGMGRGAGAAHGQTRA